MNIKFLQNGLFVGKFGGGSDKNSITYDDTLLKEQIENKISKSEKGVANGVATLDSSGLVPSSQLPSYVDDVLEFANLATFPLMGEAGKIYLALDNNKIYRFSGSVYVNISIGSGTADSAIKLATPKNIGGVAFDGTNNINLPGVNIEGNQNTTGSASKLTTPRNINNIPFDGTKDITIEDTTKLPVGGGIISGNLKVNGNMTLDNALPITSGGTGVKNLSDLKAAMGIPQFIQITQSNYNLLSESEKNDALKLYLIIG